MRATVNQSDQRLPLEAPRLVRAIGRWSLAALMVNTMIGASVFGLPSPIAAHLGGLSPAAYLVAAAGIGVIGACPPGGWIFSLLALGFTAVLITQTDAGGIAVVAITFGIALLNWKATRRRSSDLAVPVHDEPTRGRCPMRWSSH